MAYLKGDLVLISGADQTSTCIILTEMFQVSFDNYNFYYTYCVETGLYGVVYETEITSLVAPNFAPDFVFESALFDTDYDWDDYLYDQFSYFPSLFPSGSRGL